MKILNITDKEFQKYEILSTYEDFKNMNSLTSLSRT